MPEERFAVLKQLHDAGIKTWVSLEPVLDIRQSLEIIDITHSYVDEYKVGKLNGYSIAKNNPYALNVRPDWEYFLHQAVKKLQSYDKRFYIKKDLRQYDETIGLRDCEKDADHLTVKFYDKAA